MKRLAGLLGIFFISGILFCGTSRAEPIRAVSDVRLSIHAPFSTATITINRDGTFKYEAEAPQAGNKTENDSGRIPESKFAELQALINTNHFWTLNKEYINHDIAGLSTVELAVRFLDKNQLGQLGYLDYAVSCEGKCPGEMMQIVDKIKVLYGKPLLEIGE